MRVLATLALLLLSLAFSDLLFAEDGLVVHFTIKKTLESETSTYTNGVLMHRTEASAFTFPGQFELRLEAKEIDGGKENLIVTLKDLSSGSPVYAGSGAATIKVGASQTVALHELKGTNAHYEVSLDTAYGQLPTAKQP